MVSGRWFANGIYSSSENTSNAAPKLITILRFLCLLLLIGTALIPKQLFQLLAGLFLGGIGGAFPLVFDEGDILAEIC